MKKFFLVAFIVFDVALIGASVFVLTTYVKRKLPQKMNASKITVTSVGEAGSSSATVKLASAEGATTPAGTASSEGSVRKILFAYRNSKVKQVGIRSDFTGWKAEPMVKAANGSWTYLAHLTPGEYAYCFTVGDKIINDPANRRTKVIGRTTVSSIVVEALPAKAAR